MALFDTGAHCFSFVSRKVAAWIMARRGNELKRKDARQDKGAVLACTAQSTHVYGCVMLDLTFVNEVTNNPETIFSISAKIIDSCISIIIGRPIIRAYHLVHKIPRY